MIKEIIIQGLNLSTGFGPNMSIGFCYEIF